ncbi:hypothetical protein K9M79_00665 [Candidatus Woesearchaeota archaeon]|nr:hypothetical protein [Candidatus Woesearchaeota archaeon]
MGKNITNQTQSLSPEERTYAHEMFTSSMNNVLDHMRDTLSVTPDIQRFGVESEYHLMDKNLKPADASRVIKQANLVPEAVNFQVEVVSDPFPVADGPSVCLADVVRREEKLFGEADKEGLKVSTLGLFPTFGSSQKLEEYLSGRHRSDLIFAYMASGKEKPVQATLWNGHALSAGKIHTSGLLNGLHTSITAMSEHDMTTLYNISLALVAPISALSGNSAIYSNQMTGNSDERTAIYLQHPERVGNTPRIGLRSTYINDISDYVSDVASFQPIFCYDPNDPITSFHNHLSTYWPAVRLSADGFGRVEMRAASKQPTAFEDSLISNFYVFSLLQLQEEINEELGKGSARDYFNQKLVPENALQENYSEAIKHGMDAEVTWHYKFNNKTIKMSDLVDFLTDKAIAYITKRSIDGSGLDFLHILRDRYEGNMNPSRVMKNSITKAGVYNALNHYMETTRDDHKGHQRYEGL